MIQFDRVTLSFAGHPLFEDVSFTLQKGERCALVGRNGSGKSTIFKLIAGELIPDRGAIAYPKGYKTGVLQQHIRFSKPTLREEAALGLPPGEEELVYKAEKILFGLGFTEEDLDRPTSDFSGGFQLRLHLAKVLVSEPDCLLLDEPTNYLDILSIRWLSQFLSRWQGEFILISHDREFLDSVSTHTMGIHRGKVKKFKGSTIAYYEQIVLEEEVQEKTRIKSDKKRAHAEKFIERFGAQATKAKQAQSRVKMLEREPALEKLNQIASLSFSFHEAPFPGKKMLEAQNLSFSYADEPLIRDVSLAMEKGTKVAIIGKNGRGKSTLLRLLAGELEARSGSLSTSDNMRIGYFGQTHIERLNESHTIEEEISLANPKLNYTEVKGIAGTMMFSGDLSLKKIGRLSGGERSRVLLAKILAKPCNLLLLDEPTHHLDIESVEALIDALEDFEGSIVLVTHSELILRRLVPDQLVLCGPDKQTVFLGNYDEFLDKMGWEEEEKKSPPPKSAPAPKQRLPSPRGCLQSLNPSSSGPFRDLPLDASSSMSPSEYADSPISEISSKMTRESDGLIHCRHPLKPLEDKIRACEAKIAALEQEQQRDLDRLQKGDRVQEASKAIGARQKTIDVLFLELERLYAEYEIQKNFKSSN